MPSRCCYCSREAQYYRREGSKPPPKKIFFFFRKGDGRVTIPDGLLGPKTFALDPPEIVLCRIPYYITREVSDNSAAPANDPNIAHRDWPDRQPSSGGDIGRFSAFPTLFGKRTFRRENVRIFGFFFPLLWRRLLRRPDGGGMGLTKKRWYKGR